MIRNIKIKDESLLDGKIKTINFGNRNIIIGPKGGGKSTLFDLLANATDGVILSTTKDALEENKLSLYSININGEEIPASSLNVKNIKKGKIAKEKSKIYDLRNDIIYQDDNIKKNISKTSEFDKQKMNFAKEIIQTSEDINSLIGLIKEIYDGIAQVVLLDENNINWFSTFKLSDKIKNSDEEIFSKLNYSSKNPIYVVDGDLSTLNKQLTNYKNQINEIILQINSYKEKNNSLISQEYIGQITKNLDILRKKYNDLILITEAEIIKIKQIKKMLNCFNNSYIKIIANIKQEANETENVHKILQIFKSKSKDHFIKMAEKIKVATNVFEKFICNDVGIRFNNKMDVGNFLSLELIEDFRFSEDDKYSLLKRVLYNAKKIQTNISNWIISAKEKGKKDFKKDLIINSIAQTIKTKISVIADGQDYETMSLGQKSIYGIKYKFNHSKDKPMFLDQPEDNLDNYTIAEDVLKMINEKKEQIFIITHNANIGILSKPDRVIVSSFKASMGLDQYIEGTIVETEIPSDTAHYLEGGLQYITDRLKIIKGEK